MRTVNRSPGERVQPDFTPAVVAQEGASTPARLLPLTEDLNELAEDLRCSRRHVEQMDRDGRLGPRAIQLGRRRVWLRTEVEAWLKAGAPDRLVWLSMREGQS